VQVERHRQAAAAARETALAKEQQVKDLAKEGARADKDRWGSSAALSYGCLWHPSVRGQLQVQQPVQRTQAAAIMF
jgi:hypothetical protein